MYSLRITTNEYDTFSNHDHVEDHGAFSLEEAVTALDRIRIHKEWHELLDGFKRGQEKERQAHIDNRPEWILKSEYGNLYRTIKLTEDFTLHCDWVSWGSSLSRVQIVEIRPKLPELWF